jgi:hypothetical protein
MNMSPIQPLVKQKASDVIMQRLDQMQCSLNQIVEKQLLMEEALKMMLKLFAGATDLPDNVGNQSIPIAPNQGSFYVSGS